MQDITSDEKSSSLKSRISRVEILRFRTESSSWRERWRGCRRKEGRGEKEERFVLPSFPLASFSAEAYRVDTRLISPRWPAYTSTALLDVWISTHRWTSLSLDGPHLPNLVRFLLVLVLPCPAVSILNFKGKFPRTSSLTLS